MERLNPLNDFAFKKIMGEKGKEDSLLSFLNAVLEKTGENNLKEVQIIENKELTKEYLASKQGILDVRAKTSDNRQINIEVQLADRSDMKKRTLFYWSKLYADTESIIAGDDYSELPKVITINILNFNLIDTNEFHNTYHIANDDYSDDKMDMLEIHFIEMKKFQMYMNKDKRKALHRWLRYFDKKIPREELEELKNMDVAIEKAERVLQHIGSDESTMEMYRLREKGSLDYVTGINNARKEGLKEGLKEGSVKRAYKIALNLIDIGLDDENIAKASELTLEEVKALRNRQ